MSHVYSRTADIWSTSAVVRISLSYVQITQTVVCYSVVSYGLRRRTMNVMLLERLVCMQHNSNLVNEFWRSFEQELVTDQKVVRFCLRLESFVDSVSEDMERKLALSCVRHCSRWRFEISDRFERWFYYIWYTFPSATKITHTFDATKVCKKRITQWIASKNIIVKECQTIWFVLVSQIDKSKSLTQKQSEENEWQREMREVKKFREAVRSIITQ